MARYRSSLHKYRSYKRGWIAWMIQENFKIKNRITVGFFSRSQSTGSRSKSSIYVEPRPKHATWNMEFVWDTWKRFWQSTFCVRFVTDTFTLRIQVPQMQSRCRWVQGHLSREVKNELGARLQCRCLKEGRQPRILEIPRISMTGQQSLQISELQFDRFSTPSTFSCWKLRFKTQVSPCSDFPSEAMLWIKKWRWSIQWMNLYHREQLRVLISRIFELLDAKIASALNYIIQSSYFKKMVSLEEQIAQKEDRFLRGWQIACLIYDYFRVTGAHDTILDYADLFSTTLRNDDVQKFDTRWDEIL